MEVNKSGLIDSLIPEVLEDNRWGWTQYYIGIRGERLLINPTVRKCVAFLGRIQKGEEKIVATAFFVQIKVEHLFFVYLVTAGHIIKNTKSRDYSDDRIVYLLLNAKSGTRFQAIRSRIKDWYFHPTDDAVDIAVLPLKISPEADHTALDFEPSPRVEAEPTRWWFDIGTDVFITGLFLSAFWRPKEHTDYQDGNYRRDARRAGDAHKGQR